jgi:hypothetical protein
MLHVLLSEFLLKITAKNRNYLAVGDKNNNIEFQDFHDIFTKRRASNDSGIV